MAKDVLNFYARSAHVPAGRDPGEVVADPNRYAELNRIVHWRRIFSSLWTHENPDDHIAWRGRTYRSHSHAFQAAKFAYAGRPDVAERFSVESGTDLGANGTGLDAHRNRKIALLGEAQLAMWAKAELECKREIYAAKYGSGTPRRALLATGEAELWNRGPRIRTLRNLRLEELRASLTEETQQA